LIAAAMVTSANHMQSTANHVTVDQGIPKSQTIKPSVSEPFLGAGQAKVLPQQVKRAGPGRNMEAPDLAVDGQLDGRRI